MRWMATNELEKLYRIPETIFRLIIEFHIHRYDIITGSNFNNWPVLILFMSNIKIIFSQ